MHHKNESFEICLSKTLDIVHRWHKTEHNSCEEVEWQHTSGEASSQVQVPLQFGDTEVVVLAADVVVVGVAVSVKARSGRVKHAPWVDAHRQTWERERLRAISVHPVGLGRSTHRNPSRCAEAAKIVTHLHQGHLLFRNLQPAVGEFYTHTG